MEDKFRLGVQGQVAAVSHHPVGAELWGWHPQPGSAPASASSSLCPFPLFPGQAARSSLWCAGSSLMAQPSQTISAALTPKCPSGRGAATPSPVPRGEYLGREPGGNPGWKGGKFPPGCHSWITAPTGDTAWLEQLCWGMGLGVSPLYPRYSVSPSGIVPAPLLKGKG